MSLAKPTFYRVCVVMVIWLAVMGPMVGEPPTTDRFTFWDAFWGAALIAVAYGAGYVDGRRGIE